MLSIIMFLKNTVHISREASINTHNQTTDEIVRNISLKITFFLIGEREKLRFYS